jgi:peptidyl-prolyl cis-trans isomerase D
MLLFFRKWLTSWPVLALLGAVLLAFVITGVRDPFGGGASAPGGSLATVGDTAITESAFLSQFDRVVKNARVQTPTLTAQQVARDGGTVQVLDQMISSAALEQFAKANGISVSNRAVDGEIASIEAFRVGGKFDQATFKRVLSEQRITERELRDGIRGDLIRKQLLTPVTTGIQVPMQMAAPYAGLLLDIHAGAIALLPASIVPAPPAPTDAQVEAFYTANKARYTLPERRAFRYAMIDREAIAAQVAVSDADVQKYYDANKEKLGGVETRKLAQVVVPDEAKAKAIVAAVRGGKPFVQVAVTMGGVSAADVELGPQSLSKFASATNPAVAGAAFALKAPGVTDPVQSDFGWHVIAVEAISPAKAAGLAQARDGIVATLRRDKTEEALADTVAKIEDAFSSGSSFADIAKKFNLTVVPVPAMTRDGRMMDQAPFVLAPAAEPLLGKAFDADPADGGSVADLGSGQYAVLELGAIIKPTPAALARIRPAVVAAWDADARIKTLRTTVDAVIGDVNKGVPLAKALSSRNLPAAQVVSGRRIDVAQQQTVPAPIKLFLTMPAGATKPLEAPGGGGYFIVHVDSITRGDASTVPQLLDGTRAQFARAAPEEMAIAFANAAAREVGVKRNPSALAQATSRILGEDAAAKK